MGWNNSEWSPQPPMVCVNHQRFIPCRKGGDHLFSTSLDDVRAVYKYMNDYRREQDESE